MKKIIQDNLWFKYVPKLYLKNSVIFSNCYKYYLFFKKFLPFVLFQFIHNIYDYKILFSYFVSYKYKIKGYNIKKKYIQKGYKSKKLGIYFRNFLKNKDKKKNLKNNCYLIMRFKRKNFFLTLLNASGDVLCKTNIGSCGFKKKVKFTGYAIKRTSKNFYKKIINSFIKIIYTTRKNSRKNNDKIQNLILLKKNIKLNKKNNVRNIKRLKVKKINKKKNFIAFNFLKVKKLNNTKIIRSNFLKQKVLKNFDNYRNYYPDFLNNLKNSLNMIIRIKSSLKFWGFRFVMYGLIKRFHWLPVPHSKGLRLKKKRRI